VTQSHKFRRALATHFPIPLPLSIILINASLPHPVEIQNLTCGGKCRQFGDRFKYVITACFYYTPQGKGFLPACALRCTQNRSPKKTSWTRQCPQPRKKQSENRLTKLPAWQPAWQLRSSESLIFCLSELHLSKNI